MASPKIFLFVFPPPPRVNNTKRGKTRRFSALKNNSNYEQWCQTRHPKCFVPALRRAPKLVLKGSEPPVRLRRLLERMGEGEGGGEREGGGSGLFVFHPKHMVLIKPDNPTLLKQPADVAVLIAPSK